MRDMAEGHTIHRIARDHNRYLAGQRLAVSSPQGRFADGAARLDGSVLERAEAYGKNLFHYWRNGCIVHMHLGMAGRFLLMKSPPPAAADSVRLRLEGANRTADLIGPMRCALIEAAERDALVARLGPDVLRRDANPERAWAKIRSTRKPVGALLMDQSVVAGVGNIYRCEALFLTRISPARPGKRLNHEEFEALWALLVRLMRRGVQSNRILTLGALEPGKAETNGRFYVYKREQCLECGSPIRAWNLMGRTAYACMECQR